VTDVRPARLARPLPVQMPSAFIRVRRQRYCSDNCRKTAWARRRAATAITPTPAPPPGPRRDVTVYSCPSCDTRYYAQQWCHDCNQPG